MEITTVSFESAMLVFICMGPVPKLCSFEDVNLDDIMDAVISLLGQVTARHHPVPFFACILCKLDLE